MRRADRLFDIIQRLRTATKPVTAAALAEELEVTVRTIYRDIATLQARRVPIEGAAGVGYVLRKGFDLPPLMFTIDEIEAIAVGRAPGPAPARLRSCSRPPTRVLAKVTVVLPERLRGHIADAPVYVSPGDAAEPRASTWPRCAPRSATAASSTSPMPTRRAGAPTAHDLADRHGLLRRCHPGRRLVRAARRLPQLPRRAHPVLQGAGRAFRPGWRKAVSRMVGAPQGAADAGRIAPWTSNPSIRSTAPFFAGEVSGVDLRKPLSHGRSRRRPCRHGRVRRAGVPRPAASTTSSSSPSAAASGRSSRRPATSPRREDRRLQHGPERHLQPRQEQQGAGARRPPPAVRPGQPAVALRQLVQGGAGEVFAALGAHASRRPAATPSSPTCAPPTTRSTRRPRREVARPDLRAQPDLLARHPGLHRLHRRGAREVGAGAPAPGAPPSGDRPAVALSRRATPARSRAGRCPRRAPSCATSTSTRRSASSSTPTSGGRTTW